MFDELIRKVNAVVISVLKKIDYDATMLKSMRLKSDSHLLKKLFYLLK